MRWALLGAVCLFGCSVDKREKPPAPDMTELVEAYANPTRFFDEPTAHELKDALESKVRALFDLEALAGRFESTLAALDDDAMMSFTGGGGKPPVDLTGEGYARIERICTGHGTPAPPVDKAANGYLQLTVGFSNEGIDPVIYGTAAHCAEQIDTKRLLIGAEVNLYVGTNLKLVDLPVTPILFQLAGSFAVNDQELVAGGFDFQVCRGDASHCKAGFVEMLLELPAGGTLVFFIDAATKSGGFRGANGIWTCAFLDGTCTDEQANTVATPVYQL